MYECDKKLLDEVSESRNLTLRTKQGYQDAINSYVKFHNKSFVFLLEAADNEEEISIRWKNRKIRQRLMDFRVYLQKKYLMSTAKVYFQRIVTLYRHFEIEIHNLPPLSTKSGNVSKPITFEDLPTKEMIRDAIEISSPVMRAIILFMATSGCARRETLNLTIQDFIDASYEYHNSKDVKDALVILNKRNDVVPTFRIRRQKTNKFYFTFCSPEASCEIVNYLLKNRKLNADDKLFKINLDYLNKNFGKINDELGLGKVGKYNKFRSHMLRKFHASTLYNDVNGLNLSEIDSLQGRRKNIIHSSYFMENPKIMKYKYISAIPLFSIYD